MLSDVQKQSPKHKIPIDRVGIDKLRYPIRVLDKKNNYQVTTGLIRMSVDLPESFRGTHMSRFVSILNRHRGEITFKQILPILEDIKKEFSAEKAHFKAEFPYFIEKEAPVSKEKSFLSVDCFFLGDLDDLGNFRFRVGVRVPVTTLCPCSKEISEYGAHNQKAIVTIIVSFKDFVWIENLIDIAESSASAPIYTLLKRPDEKYLTELAYNNPYFVEDVVRNIAAKLEKDNRINYYLTEVESEESIHTHNATARIEKNKKF
jgi:GTP cyclohydrolase I